MELVNPDGSKMEIKQDSHEVKQEVKEEQKQEAPVPFLSCNVDAKGVMRIEINLADCVHSEDKFCLMRGFLDMKRDEAIYSVKNARAEMAKQQASILKASPKWPFGGLFKRR
jgi:hypothetical protein